MWRVTTDDISNLKQGLVSIFNDSFCRRLIETSQVRNLFNLFYFLFIILIYLFSFTMLDIISQGRSQADAGFMDVLLRKIKRLIQFVPVR